MQIEILGAESLGVRGLCCVVRTADRQVVIDPGVALGYRRAGLLPHPVQVAAGEDVRKSIIKNLETATDVVFSHFHGDHIPLANANPYQLSLDSVAELLRSPRLWLKGVSGETPHIAARRDVLLSTLERTASPCDGQTHGPLTFSESMPHGLPNAPMGTVMMTRIEDGIAVFVHASDIQLLADEPVSQIIEWAPTILLVGGPALYRDLGRDELAKARKRVRLLAEKIDVCIIDHHLLRCEDGVRWLDALNAETHGRIACAADFMQRPRRFLEAERAELYERFPVPAGWHESYASAAETTLAFRPENKSQSELNT